MESMARSAARMPCAIRSSARWKSNQPISPTRGEIRRSGGSPARRARVMRSCMMLKASTITEEMPGRAALPKNSRFMARSAENSRRKPRLGAASGPIAAASVGAEEEMAEDVWRLQAARPFLEPVEMARGIGAADHRADRGTDHDVGDNAVRNQRPHDADMGKAACRAAAQCQTDHRAPLGAEANLVVLLEVRSAVHPTVQHRKLSLDAIMPRRRDVASPDRLHGLCRMGAAKAGIRLERDISI